METVFVLIGMLLLTSLYGVKFIGTMGMIFWEDMEKKFLETQSKKLYWWTIVENLFSASFIVYLWFTLFN